MSNASRHPDALSIDEVIGRMIMVGVRGASGEDAALREDMAACRAAHVGGVILFDTHLPEFARLRAGGVAVEEARLRASRNILSPMQVPELCREIKTQLGPGTIVSLDQEGGRVARLNPARGFEAMPSARAFGRADARDRGRFAGSLAQMVGQAGFNLNFVPCLDVDVNPVNPVIGAKERSFSAVPTVVSVCAQEVISPHWRRGIATCLKHFPGHGSSATDSHLGFVDITASWQREVELSPFQDVLIAVQPNATRPAVMTGHLFHAGVDKDHPASLSRAHTTGLLRGELAFEGVVITDSLDMGAITQRYGAEEALVLAINAGADILLDGNNAPGPERACPALLMLEAISKALKDGRIEGGEARLRESARRIAGLLPR